MSESEDSQVFDTELDALVNSWVSPQQSPGTVEQPLLSPLTSPLDTSHAEAVPEHVHIPSIPPQHKCVVCLLSDDQVRPAQSRFSDACHCVECTFHDACLRTYVDSKIAGDAIWLGQGNVPPTVGCPICRQHRTVVESPTARVGRYSELLAVEAAKWLSRVYITRLMIHCWWAFNLVTGLVWKRPLFSDMSWGDVVVASWILMSMFEIELKETPGGHRRVMIWGGEHIHALARRTRTLRVNWFHIVLIDHKWIFRSEENELPVGENEPQITPWVNVVSKTLVTYRVVAPMVGVLCVVSAVPLPFVTDCLPFTMWFCHHAWPLWTFLCGACGLMWVYNPLWMCKFVFSTWLYMFRLMLDWLQRQGYVLPQRPDAIHPEIMAWANILTGHL